MRFIGSSCGVEAQSGEEVQDAIKLARLQKGMGENHKAHPILHVGRLKSCLLARAEVPSFIMAQHKLEECKGRGWAGMVARTPRARGKTITRAAKTRRRRTSILWWCHRKKDCRSRTRDVEPGKLAHGVSGQPQALLLGDDRDQHEPNRLLCFLGDESDGEEDPLCSVRGVDSGCSPIMRPP